MKIIIKYNEDGRIEEVLFEPNRYSIVEEIRKKFNIPEVYAEWLIDAHISGYEEGQQTVFEQLMLEANKEVAEWLEKITETK